MIPLGFRLALGLFGTLGGLWLILQILWYMGRRTLARRQAQLMGTSTDLPPIWSPEIREALLGSTLPLVLGLGVLVPAFTGWAYLLALPLVARVYIPHLRNRIAGGR